MSPDGYSAVRILFFAHSLDYVRKLLFAHLLWYMRIGFCTLVVACVKLHFFCKNRFQRALLYCLIKKNAHTVFYVCKNKEKLVFFLHFSPLFVLFVTFC